MAWTVGQTAKLAKVSVRTLHHYDEIGLLEPSGRSDAGYRLYVGDDLERLHQILLFRELGFTLDEIRRIVLDPSFDRADALRTQRALLQKKKRRTESMLAAIDAALDATEKGREMSDQERAEMFGELFDGFNPDDYAEEAEQRWGETDAYKQSAERTKRYTKDDWAQIKAETEAYTAEYVELMDAGVPADSPQAMAVAETHRLHIQKWFYDIPYEFFGNMSHIWVNDPRFTKNIDKAKPGLAQYEYDATQALVASKRG